ncbi:Hypothetical predicted protein [Paramuricea clavata]|uniref:Uncharacterized protein n=1 Tax=Paramuricea clavata TaxID=317549 RepID=A0A6S7GUI9_PARCT|nr:Hypothetical predicted protein [Paramuricea clavata]
MTLQDFAQNASQSGILTPEEMVLFYEKFSGVERTSEVWNMSETRAKEDILLRCCRFDSYGIRIISATVSTCKDAPGILFSKPVKIHGVLLLGTEGDEYNVKLEVWSWIIEKEFNSEQDNRGISGFNVMLPVPIKVQADVPVHLKVTITDRCWTYLDAPRVRKTVETNGITVNFETKKNSHFDEIIFSEILK